MNSSHRFTFHILLLLSFLLAACASAQIPVAPAANPGDILYQEEFEDNTTGWDRVANDHGIMDYDSGGYRFLVKQADYNLWSTPEKNYGDVRIEADVLKLAGPDENRMGLMCRYQGGDYYFFIISNDGYYAIGKFINGQTALLGQSEMQPSALIQPNMISHLRADCVGNMLTFYVNFNEVATVQDADLPSGDIGVVAGTFSQPGADVSFDNFVVMQP